MFKTMFLFVLDNNFIVVISITTYIGYSLDTPYILSHIIPIFYLPRQMCDIYPQCITNSGKGFKNIINLVIYVNIIKILVSLKVASLPENLPTYDNSSSGFYVFSINFGVSEALFSNY